MESTLTDSFGVQASYKFGPSGQDMLNVRGDNVAEFAQTLEALKGGIGKIQEVGAMIRDAGPATTEQAVANIRQHFPGAQVVQDGPAQPDPTPPPPADPWASGAGTGAPNAAATAYPTPASAPSAAAQCPACSRGTACPDCGGPTLLGIKQSKQKNTSYNAHMCTANDRHKVVWCKTPIPASMQPMMGNPNLVYG